MKQLVSYYEYEEVGKLYNTAPFERNSEKLETHLTEKILLKIHLQIYLN